MTPIGILKRLANRAQQLTPSFATRAVANWGSIRVVPRIIGGCGLVLAVAVIAAVVSLRQGAVGHAGQTIAFWLALLSFLGSITATSVARAARVDPTRLGYYLSAIKMARITALLAGATAAVILLIVLGIRMVYLVIDLVTVQPSVGVPGYGFGPGGLWSWGVLFGAGAIALVSTRESQLYTAQLWLGTLAATWACLLPPVYRPAAAGGLRQTGALSALMVALAVILFLATMGKAWIETHLHRQPSFLPEEEPVHSAAERPGFRLSCGVLASAVILLACYHLAVPVALERGGYRLAALSVALTGAVGAAACLVQVARGALPELGDAGMALFSLFWCGLAVTIVPSRPETLAERYPMVFNAMVIGLASAVVGCIGLASPRRTQWRTRTVGALHERLTPHAKRFAFINAVLALTLAGLMALWPRFRSIGVSDASIGRITAGFGANLFLLLVMLECARRLKRLTFHLLTILALVSTAGFMIMRMLPFTPRFG